MSRSGFKSLAAHPMPISSKWQSAGLWFRRFLVRGQGGQPLKSEMRVRIALPQLTPSQLQRKEQLLGKEKAARSNRAEGST